LVLTRSKPSAVAGGFENVIVLSDEFFREVTTHSIPTDLEAAKAYRPLQRHWTHLCGFRIAASRPTGSNAFQSSGYGLGRTTRERRLRAAAQISRAAGRLARSRSFSVARLSGPNHRRWRLHADTTCTGAGQRREHRRWQRLRLHPVFIVGCLLPRLTRSCRHGSARPKRPAMSSQLVSTASSRCIWRSMWVVGAQR
jgi:hypothetical protein